MLKLSSLNFSWLARMSTGRAPVLKGLLPPLGTLFTLLATALVVSGAWWLWMGATATAALFLPFYAKTFFAICGLTVLNFVFSREIQTFMFSTREVRENFIFDKDNPTDLRKLVNHVRMELNAYFKQKYGDKHVDMPMPRLLTYTDPHFEIETVEGMNPWNSAILFSSGVFNSHETGMNQRDLAAYIAAQMAKIYLQRGNSNIIVRMSMDLLSTLENLRNANWFTKMLSTITWPLEFLFIFERSVRRSHEYEAAGVVAGIGRGMDYIHAIDQKVCPTLYKKPTTKEMNDDKKSKQRAPYNGALKSIIGPVVDWVKTHLELPEDHRDSNLFWVALGGFVREFGFHIRELSSKNPRATRLKEYLRDLTGEGSAQTHADVKNLHERDKVKNQALYDQIPVAHRYDVIGPAGRGKAILKDKQIALKPKVTKVAEDSDITHVSPSVLHQHGASKAKETAANDSTNTDTATKSNKRRGTHRK